VDRASEPNLKSGRKGVEFGARRSLVSSFLDIALPARVWLLLMKVLRAVRHLLEPIPVANLLGLKPHRALWSRALFKTLFF
jgi:hypothetical protein